jgi:hypothetical protein
MRVLPEGRLFCEPIPLWPLADRIDDAVAQMLSVALLIPADKPASPLGPEGAAAFVTRATCPTAGARRNLGLALVSEKTGEERVHRIVTKDISPKRKERPGRKAA